MRCQTPTEVLKVKKAVRERDGKKCRECAMTAFESVLTLGRTLEVHRLFPGSFYVEEHCITLCQTCHDKIDHSELLKKQRPVWPKGLLVCMTVNVRLSAYANMEKAAERAGVDVSTFLKRVGLTGARKVLRANKKS